MNSSFYSKIIAGGLFALGLSACAHEQLSPAVIAASEAPVRAAQEAGADKVPKAALHMKLAREEMEEGKKLAKDGDKRAPLLFERAKADAELALAMAQEKTTQDQAKDMIDQARDTK